MARRAKLAWVAAAVGIAYGSAALFGVSFALGAFFAGMMLSESHLSQRADLHAVDRSGSEATLAVAVWLSRQRVTH